MSVDELYEKTRHFIDGIEDKTTRNKVAKTLISTEDGQCLVINASDVYAKLKGQKPKIQSPKKPIQPIGEILREYNKKIIQDDNYFGTRISINIAQAMIDNKLPNLFAEVETDYKTKRYAIIGMNIQEL